MINQKKIQYAADEENGRESCPKTGAMQPESHPAGHRDSQIRIVEAGMEDLDLLMEWRERVLKDVFGKDYPQDQKTAKKLLERNRAYYQSQLGRGHFALFVQNEAGKIMGCGGMCLYEEMPSPDNPGGKCSYFMNIYTDPIYRHQGCAKALVQALIERSRNMGAGKIYLETSDAGRPLYEKLGFHDMAGYLKLDTV